MESILTLRRYDREVIAHSHDHPQLVFGLSGCLAFEVDGQGGQVGPRQLMVVPSSAHHACESVGGSQCLVLDADAGMQGQLDDDRRALLDRNGVVQLDERQGQLVQWLATGRLDDPLTVRQGGLLLLAGLGGSPGPQRNQLPYSRFARFIEQHAGHPLQVSDLARLANLSSARLHARFIDEQGITPMDYIRQQRLALAEQLLRHTNLPVQEIAARTGYASQSAFGAAFKRARGYSPAALRRGDPAQ